MLQYDLGAVARSSLVNDSDATSWRPHGDRPWLWVMAQPLGAYFQSPLPRSPRAFALLIAAWLGLRVREGYSVSQHWQGLGQHCFAPLIRTAKGLAAHRDAGLARCGGRRPGEWQRLGHRGLERPTGGQGAPGMRASAPWAPTMVRGWTKPGRLPDGGNGQGSRWGCFWTARGWQRRLIWRSVPPRFGVLWRQRSQGTGSEKGNGGVERVLSRCHPCRLRGRRRSRFGPTRCQAGATGRRLLCAGFPLTSPYRRAPPRDQLLLLFRPTHGLLSSRTSESRIVRLVRPNVVIYNVDKARPGQLVELYTTCPTRRRHTPQLVQRRSGTVAVSRPVL